MLILMLLIYNVSLKNMSVQHESVWMRLDYIFKKNEGEVDAKFQHF